MTIVVAGDSFVYGSELQSSTNTFAELLVGKCDNIAWPGFGNDSIARTTIARCEQGGVDGVLVNWTFPGRYEFRFAYDTGQKKSPWYTINSWLIDSQFSKILGDQYSLMPRDYNNNKFDVLSDDESKSRIIEDQILTIKRAQNIGIVDFAKEFYKHIGLSEYWEIYSSLKEIVYLQTYLKVKNIPYMFMCADNSILYNHTVSLDDDTIQSLYQQIINDNEHWFWFPAGTDPHDTCEPRGFYQWAMENKYRMGTTHPLEEAHQDAAQLMQRKFNELVKKSI
jgi:hypothetical protein